jgi:hypothetical protein
VAALSGSPDFENRFPDLPRVTKVTAVKRPGSRS